MIISLYSIHDVKMGVFLAPFPARNAVEAARQLKAAMADPQMRNADFVLTPSDFVLYEVACFDDVSGEISADSISKELFKLDTLVGTVSP